MAVINISDCTISCGEPNEDKVYDINNLTVEYEKEVLEIGKDYYPMMTSRISNNYIITEVTINGLNNYEGTKTEEFVTEKILLDINNYEFSIDEAEYTGKEIIPKINSELVPNKDYIVTKIEDNIEVGIGIVYLKGTGRCTGELIHEFMINSLDIGTCEIIVPEISNESFDKSKVTVKKGNNILNVNKDYTIEIEEGYVQDAKISTIIVYGKDNCIGQLQKIVYLNGKTADISKENIELSTDEFEYTGEEIVPEIVSDDVVEGIDYTVELDNNIDAGKGSITLRGMGVYENSSLTKGFTIDASDISNATISCGEPNVDDVYDISNLLVTYGDTVLIRYEDYTIKIDNFEDYNRLRLVSTVRITGKGNYTGTKSQSFDTEVLQSQTPEPENPQYVEQLESGLPIKLTNAKVYSTFSSRRYEASISGIYYIYDDCVRNKRVRVVSDKNGLKTSGMITGWISLDDILVKHYKYQIGDKVVVNGTIYRNPNGTGNRITKESETMYIVNIVDEAEYQYNYAVASTSYNNKQGWCSEDILSNALD